MGKRFPVSPQHFEDITIINNEMQMILLNNKDIHDELRN